MVYLNSKELAFTCTNNPMSFGQSTVSSSDNSSLAEVIMPSAQSVCPPSVEPTTQKASGLHTTSSDPPHYTPSWDVQTECLDQGKNYPGMPEPIINTAERTADDGQLVVAEASGPKALAGAIAGKVFEVLEKFEQQICFRDWHMLDEIKETVNGTLSSDFFMHFIELDTDLGICYSRLTKALEQFDHYLASVQFTSGEIDPENLSKGEELLREFVEIDQKIGKLGLDLYRKMKSKTKDVLTSLQDCRDQIEYELKSGWKSQNAIEAEQQWVEAVGHAAIPHVSGTGTAVANILGNSAMLGVSLANKEQLEVIGIHQEMFEQEKQKVIELERSITESQLKIRELCSIWQTMREMPELIKPADTIIQSLRRMRSVDIITFLNIRAGLFQAKDFIEALKSPIRDLVIQLAPYYQPGMHIIREVETFTRYAPDIVNGLNLLLSAKKIIDDTREEDFERAVLELCTIISHQTQEIQNIYGNRIVSIAPELQDTFRCQTEAFETQFRLQMETIKEILVHDTSEEKSQQAVLERTENDRYYKTWDWEGRPAVDSDEALDALRRDGDQTYDWALPKEMLNETLHGRHSLKSPISMELSTVSSALDNLVASRYRKVVEKKAKEQAPSADWLTRFKRGFFIFKGI